MSVESSIGKSASKKQNIRMGVFIPSFLVVGGAALLGIFNNAMLAEVAMNNFMFSLRTFGWLYQVISIVALFFAAYMTFSKLGNIRFGGKDAKPNYPFMAWFAMALTGGIATGVVTYGANEPIIYFGNIYGELSQLGVQPGTAQAAIFAIGRCFYNWSFIPYAMYSICGMIIAYVYFNKKQALSVTASLVPLFGEKVTKGIWANILGKVKKIRSGPESGRRLKAKTAGKIARPASRPASKSPMPVKILVRRIFSFLGI